MQNGRVAALCAAGGPGRCPRRRGGRTHRPGDPLPLLGTLPPRGSSSALPLQTRLTEYGPCLQSGDERQSRAARAPSRRNALREHYLQTRHQQHPQTTVLVGHPVTQSSTHPRPMLLPSLDSCRSRWARPCALLCTARGPDARGIVLNRIKFAAAHFATLRTPASHSRNVEGWVYSE